MSKRLPRPVCEITIRNLATAFHTRLRRDHMLAPVFASSVGTTDAEWDRHTAQLEDFWSSIFLARSSRAPLLSSPCLPDLEPALFERWLGLFTSTCTDLFEPEVADALLAAKGRIAASLRHSCRRAAITPAAII